jgi:hypothetical protein
VDELGFGRTDTTRARSRRRSNGMAAKEKKTTATAAKKPATRRTTKKAAEPEITDEMIAERAYHISQSGNGGSDEENWLRAEAELRGTAS